jgi:hypothetical protein
MVTFITRADVVGALNMVSVDVNTYRLYGENISVTAIDSHVDYANTYVSMYVSPTITPSDPRYPAAKLASLNMAMIRIVIVALGGVLYDNVNYQVGEIQVNVGPMLEQTIRSNLELWREHFDMAMDALMSGMRVSDLPFNDILNSYLRKGVTTYDAGV